MGKKEEEYQFLRKAREYIHIIYVTMLVGVRELNVIPHELGTSTHPLRLAFKFMISSIV